MSEVFLEAIARGRYAVEAVRLLADADALRDQIRAPRPPRDQESHDRHLETLRADLGADAFREAWNEGRAMGLDEAIALARKKAS